ncbi:MAG: hypothetical protein DI556_20730 [Rhodovulum sulfidophilum]|uniref:Type II toxin-antitoxin system RelE/ParE family toxin n=1 Tax=Rhodovulum sulfidophilum TaxID=35806 RepID=A0A2W5MZS0_RHOSU|nr:MAG: hypothetical protein DI556_20730 [Rhodovulum sulfidophilum]
MSRPYALRLTESAESDLADIWSYIASEASEETASQFVGSLGAHLEQLRHAPYSGPPRPQLAERLRMLPHGKYAVYYIVREFEVVVVRVIHGARDHAAMAMRGAFQV